VPPSSHAATSSDARLSITIPRASPRASATARRGPKYVSAATQSATLDVTVQGSGTQVSGYPTTVDLTPTSTGCSSSLASTVCTLSLALAPGSYELTVTTYDQLGGAGNALSAAQSVPFTVVAGQANSVSLTLGGLPSSVAIYSGSAFLTTTSGGFTLKIDATATAFVYGLDADGNIILGAGAPTVSLTSNTPAQVSVSGPSSANPNAFTLTSNAQSASVTLTASATPTATSGASALTATAAVAPPGGATIVVLTGRGTTAYDEFGNLKSNVDSALPVEAVGITYAAGTGTLYATTSGSPLVEASTVGGVSVPLTGSFSGINNGQGTALAYDQADGWLYIADQGNGTVTAYDLNGNEQTLTAPMVPYVVSGITYDGANGFLYLTTPSGTSKITAYDGQGNRQTLSGGFPGFINPTYKPSGIAYDSANGLIYVTVPGPGKIFAYDADGNARTLAGTFPGLGTVTLPIAYDSDDGLLYVGNLSAKTVQAFDENGNFVRSFSSADTAAPTGIAVVP
jgi:DNA-binding beta-propeller fold protein YncE